MGSRFFSVEFGVYLIALMNFVALWRAWPFIMERINERRRDDVSERERDVQLIRDERDRLRARLDVCERETAACLKRAITAEAQLLGIGMGRQEAATIVAVERLTGAKKRDDKGGGE